MAITFSATLPELARAFIAPDGTKVEVELTKVTPQMWSMAFARNGDTVLTGAGYGVTIFRQVIRDLKDLVGYAGTNYLICAARTGEPGRHLLYQKLVLRACRRTSWQLIPNPLDPYYELPEEITNFIMDNDRYQSGDIELLVIRKRDASSFMKG